MAGRAYNLTRSYIKSLYCLNPNEEELTNTKTLTKSDACLQKLNPCDGVIDVILPDPNEADGMMFWIINSTIGVGALQIYDNVGGGILSIVRSNQICQCVCIGKAWGIYTPTGIGQSSFNPTFYYTKTEVDTMLNNLRNDLQNQIDNLQSQLDDIRYV